MKEPQESDEGRLWRVDPEERLRQALDVPVDNQGTSRALHGGTRVARVNQERHMLRPCDGERCDAPDDPIYGCDPAETSTSHRNEFFGGGEVHEVPR